MNSDLAQVEVRASWDRMTWRLMNLVCLIPVPDRSEICTQVHVAGKRPLKPIDRVRVLRLSALPGNSTYKHGYRFKFYQDNTCFCFIMFRTLPG